MPRAPAAPPVVSKRGRVVPGGGPARAHVSPPARARVGGGPVGELVNGMGVHVIVSTGDAPPGLPAVIKVPSQTCPGLSRRGHQSSQICELIWDRVFLA